jgi:hypothetical protein
MPKLAKARSTLATFRRCLEVISYRMDASRVSGHPAHEKWWRPNRFGWLLLLLLFAAFPLVWMGVRSFFFRDYGVLAYPVVAWHKEIFWQGEWPLWNPYSNCGAPFLAQWGAMALYPPSLIYLLLPLPWSLGVFCLLHLWLAGVGMHRLALRWTKSEFGAAFAAVAFMLGGPAISCLQWPNYAVALGWMPWIVLLVERSWREGGRTLIPAAFAAALQLLAGVPELCVLTWLLLAAFLLDELWRGDIQRRLVLRRAVVVPLIVAGLTAAQLLPFLDLLDQSQRDRQFATAKWGMPGSGWANFFVPLFHSFKSHSGPYVQEGQEFLGSYYPGVIVLLLAAIGCWHSRQRRVWILAAAVAFGFLMAAGENGFLYPLLKRGIPLMGIARYPIKFILLTAFALPLLAAFAVRRFENSELATRSLLRVTGIGLLCVALVVGLAYWRPLHSDRWSDADNLLAATLEWSAIVPNAIVRAVCLAAVVGAFLISLRARSGGGRLFWQAAAVGVLAIDLLTHSPSLQPTLPSAAFTRTFRPPDAQMAWPSLGQGRVLISPGAEQRLLRSEVVDPLEDFTGKRQSLWSNLNLIERVPKVNGSSTLQLREQAEVQRLIYDPTNRVGRGLIDFLAVTHISPAKNPGHWISRSNSCPLVTCGQIPVFADGPETLNAMASEDFNPWQTVFLPASDRARILNVTNPAAAQILLGTISREGIELELEATAPSLVVVAQSFHRAWQANLNGNTVPVLRANHAFQAVSVPAGRHRIELVYRDGCFALGGGISAMTLLGSLAWWAYAIRCTQPSPHDQSGRRTGNAACLSRGDRSAVSF